MITQRDKATHAGCPPKNEQTRLPKPYAIRSLDTKEKLDY